MPDGHHDEVRRQIVGLNARSRLVEQIAVQLAGHLPLATRDETVAALRRHGPVKIGTREVSLDGLAGRLPAGAFPVPDVATLVLRIDAAIGMAVVASEHGLPSNYRETQELARMVAAFVAETRRGPVAYEAVLASGPEEER